MEISHGSKTVKEHDRIGSALARIAGPTTFTGTVVVRDLRTDVTLTACCLTRYDVIPFEMQAQTYNRRHNLTILR